MMKLVAVSAVFLWGALCLCASVDAMQSDDLLVQTAIGMKEHLTCGTWDCDCAFKRRRGCCCAANQMYALEEANFNQMLDLWQQLARLKSQVKETTENVKISFTASMAHVKDCFGPFTTNVPIAYTSVLHNDFLGYNPSLGIFTAPRCGLYVFSFTVYSNVGDKDERLYHKVQMMKDGNVVTSMWEDNREDMEDSGTQVVLVDLRRGSQVYMVLVSGRNLCGNTEHNFFSGYLLYPKDEE